MSKENENIAWAMGFLVENGGSERVLRELHKNFGGKIITLVYNPFSVPDYFKRRNVVDQIIDMDVPTEGEKQTRISCLSWQGIRGFAGVKDKLDYLDQELLDEYDIDEVIPVDHVGVCMSRALEPKVGYLHCAYRTFTDMEPEMKKKFVDGWWDWLRFHYYKHTLGRSIMKSVQDMPNVVVNSEWSKKELKKWYDTDSTVVYPPVDTDFYTPGTAEISESGYFLAPQRLTWHKRVHAILKAFALSDERIKIVGRGLEEIERAVEKAAAMNKNIEWGGVRGEGATEGLVQECERNRSAGYERRLWHSPC